MNRFLKTIASFKEDEAGAAMVEYSILIGLIAAGIITTIVQISSWISGRWTTLQQNLSTPGTGTS